MVSLNVDKTRCEKDINVACLCRKIAFLFYLCYIKYINVQKYIVIKKSNLVFYFPDLVESRWVDSAMVSLFFRTS